MGVSVPFPFPHVPASPPQSGFTTAGSNGSSGGETSFGLPPMDFNSFNFGFNDMNAMGGMNMNAAAMNFMNMQGYVQQPNGDLQSTASDTTGMGSFSAELASVTGLYPHLHGTRSLPASRASSPMPHSHNGNLSVMPPSPPLSHASSSSHFHPGSNSYFSHSGSTSPVSQTFSFNGSSNGEEHELPREDDVMNDFDPLEDAQPLPAGVVNASKGPARLSTGGLSGNGKGRRAPPPGGISLPQLASTVTAPLPQPPTLPLSQISNHSNGSQMHSNSAPPSAHPSSQNAHGNLSLNTQMNLPNIGGLNIQSPLGMGMGYAGIGGITPVASVVTGLNVSTMNMGGMSTISSMYSNMAIPSIAHSSTLRTSASHGHLRSPYARSSLARNSAGNASMYYNGNGNGMGGNEEIGLPPSLFHHNSHGMMNMGMAGLASGAHSSPPSPTSRSHSRSAMHDPSHPHPHPHVLQRTSSGHSMKAHSAAVAANASYLNNAARVKEMLANASSNSAARAAATGMSGSGMGGASSGSSTKNGKRKGGSGDGDNFGRPASKRRDREKAHKCPHPGCIKSYLNPNGLKYHLEKGACKFVEDDPQAAAQAANAASAREAAARERERNRERNGTSGSSTNDSSSSSSKMDDGLDGLGIGGQPEKRAPSPLGMEQGRQLLVM